MADDFTNKVRLVTQKLNDETYLFRVQTLLSNRSDIKWAFESGKQNATKVFYTHGNATDCWINSPADLIAQTTAAKDRQDLTVCVIENISVEYLEAIGQAWDIDPAFFVAHASNTNKEELWNRKTWAWSLPNVPPSGQADSIMARAASTTPSPEISSPSRFLDGEFDQLDGIFEYHTELQDIEPSALEKLNFSANFIYRHVFKQGRWPVQSNTRISYCRPNAYLYLFLVDAPLRILSNGTLRKSPPTLRCPYSSNYGGVILPYLHSQDGYSLFESLQSFFQHPWHLNVLFGIRKLGDKQYEIDPSQTVLPSHALLYLLSSSLWETNLRHLTGQIKHISFKQIRNPNLEINIVLHDRREDLARLKDGLAETVMWAPENVRQYFESNPYWKRSLNDSRWNQSPIENMSRLIDEATKLEAFLMETFQLLMSSISVQDNRLSIDQSQRASRLTTLAFIYVPLSFVTGVFGMNVQQINHTGLNIWVCFVTIVGVVIVTIPIFLAVKFYEDKKDARRKAVDSEV